MEDIKLEYQAVPNTKELIPLQQSDLRKIILAEEHLSVFSIRYIVEKEEKLPRIELRCPYDTVNWGLNDEIFLRLEDEPKIEEIFHVIRTKINETKGKDTMFATYNKIKIKPLNNRNIN